jgi:hypothetical protein
MRYRFTLIAGGFLLAAGVYGQIAVKNQGYVPFSEPPVNYRSDDLSDPVAKLQKRIDKNEVGLTWEPKHGYLKSVLENLAIPVDSQTLVFSRTSFQYKKISPETPRALYFNDDVYVGQVHDGKVIEFVSFDPVQGAIFYIIDEHKSDHPLFARAELDCTQCHVAAGTRNVPGVLLRSIFTMPSGTQAVKSAAYITDQASPLSERWGGWYVTGTSGSEAHMGNVVVQDKEHPQQIDRASGANLLDLSKRFDTAQYLSGKSDVVAHLVLAHQTQMHNLITQTNYETRIALFKHAPAKQYEARAEELLRYLLFSKEAPLGGEIKGDSGYTQEFAARGPRDPQGRSLRDFDLHTRIFKYPCSYLIYSEAFDALPEPAKGYVYHRLLEVLTGQDQSPGFAHLTTQDRRAILEILLATKQELPAEWSASKVQTSARASIQDPKQHSRP